MNKIVKKVRATQICRYCGRWFGTASGCGVHEVYCEHNPNKKIKQPVPDGKNAWSRGLTKDCPGKYGEALTKMVKPLKNG